MDPRTVWRVNEAVGRNAGLVLYGIFSVAVGLQQFPETEPAALGFFWITTAGFVAGGVVGISMGNCNPWGLLANLAIQAAGVAIQVLLILTCWEELVRIDEWARAFRGALASALVPGGADHLLPMRALWVLATAFLVWAACRRGYLVARVGERPW